jgi:hypothetical protein
MQLEKIVEHLPELLQRNPMVIVLVYHLNDSHHLLPGRFI